MTSSPTPESAGPPRPALPPSPCVGICTLKGDYCYGCGRTGDEIEAWGTLAPQAQAAVWAELPARLAGMGFKTFRLAAGPAVVGDFIERTFREATGRWRLVTPRIEGQFGISADARPQVDETDALVEAVAATGERLTLVKHDRVRIFGFAAGEGTTRMNTVALVLPKGRAQRDLKEGAGSIATPNAATPLPLCDPFAEAWLIDKMTAMETTGPSTLADAIARGAHIGLRNALGAIKTSAVTLNADAAPDANAPADIKISKAFVAGAIFHADDPDWLAATLAPWPSEEEATP